MIVDMDIKQYKRQIKIRTQCDNEAIFMYHI